MSHDIINYRISSSYLGMNDFVVQDQSDSDLPKENFHVKAQNGKIRTIAPHCNTLHRPENSGTTKNFSGASNFKTIRCVNM